MNDKKSIVTSAVDEPTRIDVGDRKAQRTHSGEWVLPPTPLVMRYQDADDASPPLSIEGILELHQYHLRDFFQRHSARVDAIKRSDEYLAHVVQLAERARVVAALEGHWAHGNATRYVEWLSAAFVWAKLIA